MNLRTKTAAQLSKLIRRGHPDAAYEWADRIERVRPRACVPKKKLRAAGKLPPITHD